MDDVRFDTLTRALGAFATRRAAARTLTSGALGALALLAGHEAEAKKKKKKGKKKKKKPSQCKAGQEKCGQACCAEEQTCIADRCLGPCQFTMVDDLKIMLLQADCATTETIVIPDGFRLDGDRQTIHMAGPVTGYQSVTPANTAVRAGVLIQNGAGSVEDVTIDQDALECGGSQAHSAIVMANGEGDIESVEIVVTKDNVPCYRGIDAAVAANNDAINVRGVTISGGHRAGIAISGPTPNDGQSLATGEIRDCTIEDAQFGMLMNGTKHQIKSNTVNANHGILVGVFPSNVLIDDNTITGLTGETNPAGILYNPDTKGTVSNNAVAGFSCGISIQTAPEDVTLSGNTFPEPRNTSDLCFAT